MEGANVSKVLAKFRITSLKSQRNADYDKNPETGNFEPVRAYEAAVVDLQAVQGEPFGKYTPTGTIQMTINNEAAARIFREAWQAYITSEDPKAQGPEFYVMFQADHGEGWE